MSSSVGFTGGRQVVEFRPSGDQAWTQQAACAPDDGLDLMFPHPQDEEGIAAAKSICARCPVSERCLTDALNRGERFGVWGGLDPDERRSLKRQTQNRVSRQKAKAKQLGKLPSADAQLSQLAAASDLTVESAGRDQA